jgi:hypothetical protein
MSAWDSTNVIYSVIAVATVVSVVVGIIAWMIHRRTLRYHALVAIQKDYRSHQMGYAVDTLWRFYREYCQGDENKLRQEYHEIYKKEQKEIDEKEKAKQIMARETTLDNQRRVVFHFYNHLANRMCLGETRNNQGDSFVYDGKISKSKRKLLEGGINVFTSSFLRAKHIRLIFILITYYLLNIFLKTGLNMI